MEPKQPLLPYNSRKWIIEVTEEQLLIIAGCVEDIHRFMAGQCELDNSRSAINFPQAKEIRERLTPLKEFTGEYDWAGSGCANPSQKKIIAQTYGIYREILHQVIIHRESGNKCLYIPNADMFPFNSITNNNAKGGIWS